MWARGRPPVHLLWDASAEAAAGYGEADGNQTFHLWQSSLCKHVTFLVAWPWRVSALDPISVGLNVERFSGQNVTLNHISGTPFLQPILVSEKADKGTLRSVELVSQESLSASNRKIQKSKIFLFNKWFSKGWQDRLSPCTSLFPLQPGLLLGKNYMRSKHLLWGFQFSLWKPLANEQNCIQNVLKWLSDFPGVPVVKTPCSQCRGCGFNPGQATTIPHVVWCRPKKKKKKEHCLYKKHTMIEAITCS